MKATRLPLNYKPSMPRIKSRKIYLLEPPLPWHKYGDQNNPREEIRHILVSQIIAPDHGGPETMIFRSNEQGDLLDGEALAEIREFDEQYCLDDIGVTEIVDTIGD